MTKEEILALARKANGHCGICYAADFCPYYLSTGELCLCHIREEEE